MKSEIETAIKTLLGQITSASKADDALKYTQAALNLAHVAQVQKEVDAPAKPLATQRRDSP